MNTLSNYVNKTRYATQHRLFDPVSKEDVEEYKFFVKNGKWKAGCPFILEQPYLSVPHMINDRIIRHMFGAD